MRGPDPYRDAVDWLLALVIRELNPPAARRGCALWLHELSARLPLTAEEELELAAYAIDAYDHRVDPEMIDKVETLVAWWERRPLVWLQHRLEEQAAATQRVRRLVELMRETDPARITVRAA